MTSPARLRRLARDRAISVGLAVFIGVVLGAWGWVWWHRYVAPKDPHQPTAALTTPLLPHKALYGVTMVSARNGSQIIDIDGKMFFQMQRGCDAYVTDHRFVLTYDYADSAPMRVTSDFSTVENTAATQFDFSSRRRRDGEIYQEIRGKAEMAPDQAGTADYSQPEVTHFDLSPGTLFPAAHTQALIAAARAGTKFLPTRIFDGSDTEGPVDVTAVIGTRIDMLPTLPASPGLDRTILQADSWKIRLAFFPASGESDTADYELAMVLHENGVISDMVIDYQDFSVHQRLLALESLTPERCGNGGKTSETPAPPPEKESVNN